MIKISKFTAIACALIIQTPFMSYGENEENARFPSYVDPSFFEGSTSKLKLGIRGGQIVSIFQSNADEPLVSLKEGYFVEEIVVDEDGDGMLLMVYSSDKFRPYAYSLLLKKITVAGENHWETVKTVFEAPEILSAERSWVEDLVFLSTDEDMAILRVARTRVSEGEAPDYIKYSIEFWQIDPAKHLHTVKNLKFY